MRARLWYLFLTIVIVLLFLWSNVQSALLFAAILIAMVPLAVVEGWLAARGTTVEVLVEKGGQNELPEKDQKEEVLCLKVKVQNTSFFPVFRMRLITAVKNRLTGSEYEIPYELSVAPRKTKSICIPIESVYCGRIDGEVIRAEVFDFLSLSGWKAASKSRGNCYIYPEAVSTDVSILEQCQKEEMNIQNRYLHSKGNDISQILDIRDYQKGDNIKTIHWKLSKKLGHKLVKELDMPASQDVILFLALSQENLSSPEVIHKVAKTALQLSEELLQEQIFFDAVLIRENGMVPNLYSIQEKNAKDWYEKVMLDGDICLEQEYVDQYLSYHQVFQRYAMVILVTDDRLDGWCQEHSQVMQVIAGKVVDEI